MKMRTAFYTSLFALVFNQAIYATTYTLDPLHSYVEWKVSHFGFSTPSGKWFANGTVNYDEKKPEASQVNATLKLADIVTGIPDLDKHLKGKLFFNVEQFPTATFVSDKVEVQNQQLTKVHGQLTVHGVTKPVTLDVKLNQQGKNPITDKDAIGFSASTKLKRSDFGMTTMLPGIGDEVDISINVEAS
jgi:polyisoprenoid-binding protein YceI